MEVELLFKIAGIGILVSVLSQILNKTGRDEQATMITILGFVIVLMLVVKEISGVFDTVKTMFSL